MSNCSEPPWSEEQDAHFNEFQMSGLWHPFVCRKCRVGGEKPVLVMERDRIACPACGFEQHWCHTEMTDGSWLMELRGEVPDDER